ncbi:MAG: hypothetical protein RL757_1839 [Bacteroidota bacterium]|jgi:photosystem II stability/assembly factor-like uncharacterized protein
MHLRLKLILACFFIASQLVAQNLLHQPLSESDRPAYSADLPEFVKMTFRPDVNFKAVEVAFERYEKTKIRPDTGGEASEAIEDKYDVYFQRWRRAYAPFAQEDGSIVLPTQAEYERSIQSQNADFQRQLATRNAAANWTLVGPNETHWAKWNRADQAPCPWQVNVYAFDIAKSNSAILYAAPETGGVFKTTDKGLNWTACAPNFSFGGTGNAIEVHPTDPNTVYLGINSFLYKTTDGGNNWVDLTNCNSSGPNDIAISPADPNIVWVAADNGLFRSTNGGSTWTTIYTTPCYDIEFKVNDANTIFILKSNGTNVELLKSTDGGVIFGVKNTGATTLRAGRLAVTAANANRIYLLCTTSPNPPRLMKSLDGGETWADLNPPFCTGGVSDATGGQGYYDLSIAASQTNANELIYGFCSTAKAVSSDGGNTFSFLPIGGYCGDFPVHPDVQEMKCVWNGSQLETWLATDGGLTFSTDFFSNTSNAAARNNGIYNTDFWGFGQGWNEDIMVGGRYHNGNTALADFYPTGKALRMGGAEAGTGYVFHGQSRTVAFSDSEDKVLPSSFTGDDYGDFRYSRFPNEDGYGFNASPFLIHPNYYKHQLFGEGNTFWKTTDNGATFVALQDFGSPVRRYDMSRSNPLVIYLATDAGFHKSTNGGAAWSSLALPSGRSSGSLYIAINPTNENDVWITFKNVSATAMTGKVYQSTDGGSTWTDKTSPVLASKKIKNVVHTGGGVYISADSDKGYVYYRSMSATDWTDFSTNLPPSMDILSMKPFYRDGKMRVAGNRGIWETPLAEDVAPVVNLSVDKKTSSCSRDTFYFDDYSIVKHAGATWSWSFSPPPQYVSDANARNPKVVFGQSGNFSATMTLTTGAGTSVHTVPNVVSINSYCEPDTLPLQTLRTVANGDYFISQNANLSNLTHFTVTGWWKPNGAQQAYAALFSSGDWCAHCDDTEGLIFDYYASKLWYKWPGNSAAWSNNSGIDIPLNEWSYVALVITPTGATMYLNEKKYVDTRPLSPGQLQNIYIGFGHYDKSFKGDIDEVTMWKRALSESEIRRLRHLTKEDLTTTDVDLIGYWQFNDLVAGSVLDKANVKHGTLVSGATLSASTAPVGGGVSESLTVNSGGVKNFIDTDCQLEFPASGIYPNGDVVVTKLNVAPNQTQSNGTSLGNKYWIVNNYGTNTTFSPLTSIKFNNLTGFATGVPTNFKLYRRSANAEGATWGATIDDGDAIVGSDLTFSPPAPCMGIMNAGQFTINNDAATAAPLIANAECAVSTVVGKAMTTTNNGDYMLTPPINLGASTDQITVMAWIRPNAGTQSSYAGILSCSGVNVNLNYRDNNELGLHWNDASGSYSWSSGLIVPADEWSHVAMVANGTNMKLYLNGQEKSLSTYNPPALNLDNRQWYIGNDRNNSGRTFKGKIDEVCFYNRVLTQNEIREKMHLVKSTTDATLKGYFQFNETTGAVWNKSEPTFSALSGAASRTISTAPIGVGTSSRLAATTAGAILDFSAQHLTIELPSSGTLPNADLVVTELNVAPDQLPAGSPLDTKYWIVNNMGLNGSTLANQTFGQLARISFSDLGSFATSNPSNVKLYKRKSGNDGATWATALDEADELSSTNNNTLTFSTNNNVTSFSQFALNNEVALAVELLDFKAILNGKNVKLNWQIAQEKDVKHYEIERSFDGKTFEWLKKQDKSIFVAEDTPPQYSVVYYRLKIVENSGKVTLSPIRSVHFEVGKKANFSIYPNPAHSILNVKFTLESAQTVDFELVNAIGQIVHTYRLEAKEGNNHLFFRTDMFPSGQYFLKIQQGEKMLTEKIIIHGR